MKPPQHEETPLEYELEDDTCCHSRPCLESLPIPRRCVASGAPAVPIVCCMSKQCSLSPPVSKTSSCFCDNCGAATECASTNANLSCCSNDTENNVAETPCLIKLKNSKEQPSSKVIPIKSAKSDLICNKPQPIKIEKCNSTSCLKTPPHETATQTPCCKESKDEAALDLAACVAVDPPCCPEKEKKDFECETCVSGPKKKPSNELVNPEACNAVCNPTGTNCACQFPLAFKQFSCTGNINGNCGCGN